MTVPYTAPYNRLIGDGSITRFPFTFGIVETSDLIILVDGVLQIEFSAYTLENITGVDDNGAGGGDVLFVTAPVSGASVLIIRRTNITQQTDYVDGEPFQAETHEDGMDKIIYILQELLGGAFGGIDSDGNPIYLTLDLSVTQGVTTVTINNTGGTDAVLPPWTSGEYSGVYHGELTLSAPADESVTTKPDGYIWIEHG